MTIVNDIKALSSLINLNKDKIVITNENIHETVIIDKCIYCQQDDMIIITTTEIE